MCSDKYTFRTVEVHTLHIRDFGGERIIQSLGEERTFEISTARAREELRAVLFPRKKIFRECLPFLLMIVIGAVMCILLLFRDVMPMLRVLGVLCVFVGVSGSAGKVRDILRERDRLAGMSEDDALKYSAWRCVLKSAPKKYNDNDITYVTYEDICRLDADTLAEKYNLLPAIAKKLRGV